MRHLNVLWNICRFTPSKRRWKNSRPTFVYGKHTYGLYHGSMLIGQKELAGLDYGVAHEGSGHPREDCLRASDPGV